MITKIGIVGIGSYLPEKVMTNFDLENIVDTSPNMWTVTYKCEECKSEWKMLIRNSSGDIIRCYADLI